MYSQTISLNMLLLDSQAKGFQLLGTDYEINIHETFDTPSGTLATLEWGCLRSREKVRTETNRLSWNNMQLTEPPIAAVQVVFWAPKRKQICATVRDNGGVTCGLVREVVEKMMASVSRDLRRRVSYEGRACVVFIADDIDNMPSPVRRCDAVIPL